MNPLVISLLILGASVGYIITAMLTYCFTDKYRKWGRYQEDEKVLVSVFWPVYWLWLFGWYFIDLIIWLTLLPIRPIQVRRARIKRSGKKAQVVK